MKKEVMLNHYKVKFLAQPINNFYPELIQKEGQRW